MADQEQYVYLDNNATTAVAPEVIDAMRPYLEAKYWNPSSMYAPAMELARELDAARELVAERLGAAFADEIIFTSCATESNNAALVGGLRAAIKADPNRRQIVTTKVEHPAVLEVCKQLEKDGYEVSWVGVDQDGKLNLREYVQALQPGKTALVSIMHANNETGVIFPIEKLARLAKQTDPKIVFHVDATQSVTKLPIDLSKVEPGDAMNGAFGNVDMLSFSGHKIHAPKGSARSTSGAERPSSISSSAGIRNAVGARARKTSRTSWVWLKRSTWNPNRFSSGAPGRLRCATGSKRSSKPAFRTSL